jgi:hypothetical protein
MCNSKWDKKSKICIMNFGMNEKERLSIYKTIAEGTSWEGRNATFSTPHGTYNGIV